MSALYAKELDIESHMYGQPMTTKGTNIGFHASSVDNVFVVPIFGGSTRGVLCV